MAKLNNKHNITLQCILTTKIFASIPTYDVEGLCWIQYPSTQGEEFFFTSLICQYVLIEVWRSEKQKQHLDSKVLVKLVTKLLLV